MADENTKVGTTNNPVPAADPQPNALDTEMSKVNTIINDLTTARNTAKENDEVANRRSRSMKMIAGISDGLASLANMIGVAKGGSNIDMGTGSLTPLQQNLEKARLERKADIKSIDDRLEQYANQMRQMQVAKFGQEKEDERLQKTQDFTASEAQKRREFDENMAKIQIGAAEKAAEKKMAHESKETDKQIASAEKIAGDKIASAEKIAKTNADAGVLKYTIRYGNSNNKNLTQFVMDDPVTGKMRTIDISDKSLTNILSAYLPIAIKNGEITEGQAEEAKNWKSNEVSKTNLLGLVNSSKTMRNALLTAVNGSAEVSDNRGGGYQPTGFLWGQGAQNGAQNYAPWEIGEDGKPKYNK